MHCIPVDAEWKRARVRWEKPRSQSIAIGVLGRKRFESELTRVQLLDISRGLSFLHSIEIIHGDLKGVSIDFLRFSW